MRKKRGSMGMKIFFALLNTINLVLAVILAIEKQKSLAAVVHTVPQNRSVTAFIGGDDGPTAVFVADDQKETAGNS